MTGDRIDAIEAAIATLQRQGLPTTNDAIHKIVRGRRGYVTSYMKAWRATQRTGGARLDRDEAMPEEPQSGMRLLGMLPLGASVPPRQPEALAPEVPGVPCAGAARRRRGAA